MEFIRKAIKCWLVCILVFLPVQYLIVITIKQWNAEVSNVISRLDEFTLLLVLPFALGEYYLRRKNNNKEYSYALIAICIMLFLTAGSAIMSGVLNSNAIFVTLHATFIYVKYFLALFIYAAFFRESHELKRIAKTLLIVLLFLVGIAFIQEIWALSSRYIFQKGIFEEDMYILRYLAAEKYDTYWRFGIYRTPSLLLHPNMFGMYGLMVFSIFFTYVRKFDVPVFILIITGILISISKMVYAFFLLSVGMQFLRFKRMLMVLMIMVIIGVFIINFMPAFNFLDFAGIAQTVDSKISNDQKISLPGAISFRLFAKKIALKIWGDHPLWGVGPGMFGGALSIKYDSHIYEEYNFSGFIMQFLKSVRGLDQFWPKVIAEIGIIGLVIYFGLFVLLLMIFMCLREHTATDELKGIFDGLVISTLVIIGYGFGSTLNTTCIIFTYFAVAGTAIGCYSK